MLSPSFLVGRIYYTVYFNHETYVYYEYLHMLVFFKIVLVYVIHLEQIYCTKTIQKRKNEKTNNYNSNSTLLLKFCHKQSAK